MEQGRIKVLGRGQASGPPDFGTVTIDIISRSASGEEAFEDLAQRSRALEKLLEELPIPEEAITSTSVNVSDENHNYKVHWSDSERPHEMHAANRITVRVSGEDLASRLMTSAVRRVGAHVSGPSWQLTAGSGLHHKALQVAAEDARAKAQTQAEAMGVGLGLVLEINGLDRDYSGLQNYDFQGPMDDTYDASTGAAFRIFEGRVEVYAAIEVTFALGPLNLA